MQFGLQFSTVQGRTARTDHGDWSSLNRSGRPRPELLMRLGFTTDADVCSNRCSILAACQHPLELPIDR